MKATSIDGYHASKWPEERAILEALRTPIDGSLPGADSRIWLGAPV